MTSLRHHAQRGNKRARAASSQTINKAQPQPKQGNRRRKMACRTRRLFPPSPLIDKPVSAGLESRLALFRKVPDQSGNIRKVYTRFIK
jgi:hypothetical protein